MASIYDKASLVLIPSGTKTSKVYSQVPTNGDGDFTFSRSTAATRVNASGNIEKETENKLVQSNAFSTAPWGTIYNPTLTQGASNPFGVNDAWTFFKSQANAFIYQSTSGFSGVYTFSIYAKAGSVDQIRFGHDGGTSFFSIFDLTTGTIVSNVGSVIDSKITSAGNGWYRCSVSGVMSVPNNVRIYPASGGSTSGTTGSILIYAVQGEQGLVARDYIETTTTAIYGGITDNVPRLDYTDSSCPALLLEPQRTNSITQSEYFGSDWVIQDVSLTANSVTSPEGVQNATTLTEDVTNQRHRIYYYINTTSGTSYTLSVFVKKNSNGRFLLLNANSAFNARAVLNLDTLEITNINGTDAKIENYGNGWYKFSISGQATISSSQPIFVQIQNAASDVSYLGDGSSLYLYGAQLEVGSYATSYIPTYGSAVTRNGEQSLTTLPVSTGNGWSVLMDWTDANFQLSGFGNALFRMEMEDSNDVFALLGQGYTGQNRTRAYYNGYFGSLIDFTLGEAKVGFTADGSTIKTFVNGSLYNTSTIAHNTDFDYIRLNADAGTNAYNKLLLFQSKLTDQEMIDLTTI